jgi:hypothetical protein
MTVPRIRASQSVIPLLQLLVELGEGVDGGHAEAEAAGQVHDDHPRGGEVVPTSSSTPSRSGLALAKKSGPSGRTSNNPGTVVASGWSSTSP